MPRRHDAALLQAVIETAVDGVILIDRSGQIHMFNPACERLFGYSADEVIGRNVKMLMPAPYREEHDGYLENYHRTGDAKIIGIGRTVEGRRKDGSVFPMDLSVGESRAEGEPIFVGIIRDLSERQRQEREIREAAAQLRAVVHTAVDGVILIDAKGTIRMFNPACERLFGYDAAEVIGQNVKMLMPEPYRAEHDGYLENYRQTGKAKIIGIGREVEGRRKDGTTFPMDLSVGEAKQEGTPIYVGMIHDLTERKRVEQQLVQAQKMEAVGHLSGGIAHDFNNLLTVISGNTEFLIEALAPRPDLREMAESIMAAGKRGAELTQRLLAFSRRQMLKPEEIDCNALIREAQGLLQRTLRADIEIRMSLHQTLSAAYADANQLESAILNLALNAQDAMPDGGLLTITSDNMRLDDDYHDQHLEVRPGDYVLIAVSDTGEGMHAEVLSHVFEPFFTTKEVGKGSGLGLSMVYGFVKQSNGHVAIYSEPGLGTTVRIYLPAGTGSFAAEPSPKAGVAQDKPAPGREVILVVEDDPFVRAYAVRTLETLGYNVIAAVDAHEALAKLTGGHIPDMLFTDIVMPGNVNGWELAQRAAELLPAMKVMFTSGYALEALSHTGRLPPDVAFLNKPYRKSDLAQLVRHVLDS
ncbi:MAG: PAS domain S-box protein [Dongiaceae bacterium]